jgi:hypothetical protein
MLLAPEVRRTPYLRPEQVVARKLGEQLDGETGQHLFEAWEKQVKKASFAQFLVLPLCDVAADLETNLSAPNRNCRES